MKHTSMAIELQRAIQASLLGPERLSIALEMSEAARELALCRLREIHPGSPDAELLFLLAHSSGRSAK